MDSHALLNTAYDWNFCVESLPEAKLKVYKNNRELLFKDENIKVLKEKLNSQTSYKLHFGKITMDDAGVYKIELSNKAGNLEAQGLLTVKGLF